ncbi:MAG: serine/threonine protein kinase [Phycisphaerae bacterium]|nr:serine/threonine protein kinase [Phycisphaerae bacterium]
MPDESTESRPARPGRARLGPYEIIEPIGRGGMGIVYRARDTVAQRDVALKILPRSLAIDDTYLSRFRREAQAASKLKHPNIVTVYDHGVLEKLNYIAFELVDGPSLDRLIRQEERLAEAQVVEIALAVARALQHAHGQGVLHRDIKPGNILVTRGGDVKLADFGMAKYVASSLSFQTTVGRVFGTPAFLSPEQALGADDVDARADIYSLGCVVYNMATGRPPFQGDNPFVVIDQHRRMDPVPIRSINTQISTALEAFVSRAMAKLPEHRYQAADEVIWDLTLIRQALRAPRNARGGLSQLVAALDAINVVGRKIRAAQASAVAPTLRNRIIAAFLARPEFWLATFVLMLIGAAALALWAGIRLGAASR